jgi:hypothetical protein
VTNAEITQTILAKLDAVEKEHGVKILYALWNQTLFHTLSPTPPRKAAKPQRRQE